MSDRAQACSDAIHAALFPQTLRIERMRESRRIVAEIVRQHLREQAPVRHLELPLEIGLFAYQATWRGVMQHIRDIWHRRPSKRYVISFYFNADSVQLAEPNLMPERYTVFGENPTSDPSRVAD